MTDKQIIIDDYFNIMCDENGRILGIQEIGDQKSLIKAIKEQNEYIQAKEQELQQAMDNYVQLDLQRVKEYNELVDLYKAKEQECEELKSRLNCRCFDPSINNNRCISYNRIAEDYERDLKQLDQLKVQLLDQKVKNLKASGIICVLEQTLAEIKKICNSVENIENVNSLYDAKLSGMYLQANKILQKISEVLKDE